MPNRDPFIATALRNEISELSQNEIDALNRQLDVAIVAIDENNQLYDQYAQTWIGAREQVSDISDTITDIREKRIRAKKLKETAKKGVQTQEVVEKVNTISMSLNPVAAALQFAAKVLKTELEHELKGLQDITAIVNPSLDNLTRFIGGVLISTGETVEGELNRKIRELEERIAERKRLRKERIDKLFDRRRDRRDRIKKANEEVAAHNKRVQEEQEALAKEGEEKASTEIQGPPDKSEGSDDTPQGDNIPDTIKRPDYDPSNPDVVDEVVEGELPQGLNTEVGSGVLVTEEQTLDEEGNVSTELTEEEAQQQAEDILNSMVNPLGGGLYP